MHTRSLLFAACLCMALIACNAPDQFKSRGPIILGDSSTIVTETDPQYLGDMVADLQPAAPQTVVAPPPPDTARQPDTTAQAVTPPPPATQEEGLKVDFGEIHVFVPGIETTSFSHSASNTKSAAYLLTGGKLAGNRLQFTGTGTVTRVTQRYETVLAVTGKSGQLILESLAYTSGWQTLKGNKDAVTLSGLEDAKLQYVKATQSTIRNAVTKATRANKMSRQQQQEYLNAVRNVRAANQKPMTVVLRNVIWQISGKDSKGREFNKELRIDMPG